MKVEKKQKVFLICISTIPIIIGIISMLIVLLFIKPEVVDKDFTQMINTMIGVWGTLLGFIITSESILIGFNGSGRIKEIVTTRHYRNVLYTYSFTCIVLLICLVTFIIISLIKNISIVTFSLFIAYIITSFMFTFLCVFYLSLMVYAALH